MRQLGLISLSLLTLVGFASRMLVKCSGLRQEAETLFPGRLTESGFGTFPDTPKGVRPSQNWMPLCPRQTAIIYVTSMDHRTNAAIS
jgi:hypothetical protein